MDKVKRRRHQNRKAAQRAREKRRQELESIKQHCQSLTRCNQKLLQKVNRLQCENEQLRKEVLKKNQPQPFPFLFENQYFLRYEIENPHLVFCQ